MFKCETQSLIRNHSIIICFHISNSQLSNYFFSRNGSHIDENIRNASIFLPYIQKNNLLIILIHGFTEDINSYDIKIMTNGKLSIRLMIQLFILKII